MGQCLSACRSSDPKQRNGLANLEIGQRHAYGARAPSPTLDRSFQLSGRLQAVDFGKEETRLKELFAALRTGLVFTPTEFSVLPDITTTAKVIFSVGSSTLQNQEEPAEESEPEEAENEEEDGEESQSEEDESQSDEDESPKEKRKKKKEEDYELRVTLYGSAWTKGLSLQLTVLPVVGPFASRKLVFRWGEDLLRIQGCMKGELNARTLPVSFETETEFCKCCLLLAHHSDAGGNLHMEEVNPESQESSSNGEVPVLSSLAYRVVVSNLDAISESVNIPGKIQNYLYGSQAPVTISVRVWPSTYSSQFGANPVMKVKAGIVCSEFAYLLKEHFHLPQNHLVKLYHHYKPLQLNEVVTSKYTSIDCFVISYDSDDLDDDECCGELDEAESQTATLVISLVGYDVQNVEASLEMRLKDFDRLLRKKFRLGNESFLIILAEDDYAPQYTSSNDWKCIYPFSLPDNSFTAGLRRSMRRISSIRRTSNPNSPTQRTTQTRRLSSVEEGASFSPQIARVVEVLSSSARHFPCNGETFGLTVEELYESMPMYQLSLEQCGIHPYAIIQVFEVTGPSIPITFRVRTLTEQSKVTPQSPKTPNTPRTRLTNIMDVNPSWSIHTFLQYVDAIISPASGVRQKRITLRDRFIEDSEDLSTLTLGALLDLWKPAWWPLKGTKRKQLAVRDIDPSEFLLVEKH